MSRCATLEEITALEARYTAGASKTLAPARAQLAGRWRAGERDRETALRLAFLDWYSCSEPQFLTGLSDLSSSQAVEEGFFLPTCEHLLAAHPGDVEVLFALGWMLTSHPWCAGGASTSDVEARGRVVWTAYLTSPIELGDAVFTDRGTYGIYFAHIQATQRQ
ncbi:hypothetical protein ACFQ46_20550 [Kineococcus sp. GCM10028916]|uniref:hypothetical protein n=1 Tax=Kineococcus sp. GCM10028916 TaxID=3273394 RepID=UPI00362997AF